MRDIKREENLKKYEEEREEKLKRRQEVLEERSKVRSNSINKMNSQDTKIFQYLKEKPRYQKMEDEFNSKIEFSGLEKKKRILASLRDLHQPLNMKKIEEEQDKYVDIIRQNKEKKKQELIDRFRENEENYDYKRFHGKYMERLIENELLNKEKVDEKDEKKRNYREQIKEYDSLIKKKYKPIISKSKMEE